MSGQTVDTTSTRNRLAKRNTTPAKATAETLLQKLNAGITRALPKTVGLTPDRFTRIVLTEFRRTPRLLECTEQSILAGVMLSAQLGLEIGGPLGHSYLIPFRDNRRGVYEATWILGYKGIVQLAYRSGELQSIEARDVCANDEFRYAYGLREELHHVPASGQRGPLTHVYCVARFANGGHYWVVLTRAQVDEHRARSKSKDNGPWVTDYNAMARKTAVRVAAPFLPLSSEIARAINQDDQVLTLDGDVIDVAPEPEGEPEQVVDVETGEITSEAAPVLSEEQLAAAANEAFDAEVGQ